jgi:periplasmic divalent cation tolerance protein
MVTSLPGFVSQFFHMTREIVILCTCSSENEAEKIAMLLLEERLAACVSVVPVSRSYYWWEGAIQSSAEQLLVVKSSAGLFSQVEQAIRKIHSYEVPELLALPVLDGSVDYLKWLRTQLREGMDV